MQQNWIQAIFLFLGFLVTWAAWVLFGVFATVRLVVVDFCQNGEVRFQLSFNFFFVYYLLTFLALQLPICNHHFPYPCDCDAAQHAHICQTMTASPVQRRCHGGGAPNNRGTNRKNVLMRMGNIVKFLQITI